MASLLSGAKTKSGMFRLFLLAALLFPGLAQADANTILYIQGPGGSVLVNEQVVVPENCTVAGKDFTGHKAPCALHAAKNSGVISSFGFIDFGGSLGLFLDSVNGIATAPDWSESWQLFKNGSSSSVGIEQIGLSNCVAFQLTYGPWPTPIVGEAAECQLEGGPTKSPVILKSLDSGKALGFLAEQQEVEGSFGAPLFTDWAAVAFGALDQEHPAAEKIREYLKANPDPGPSLGHPVLSFERRAMALMALGMSPYEATSVDYVQNIVASFDGEQLGNSGLVNDDIFGLLVLLKAGYGEDDEMVASVTEFILQQQEQDGSWGGVDMTAAAVQALSLIPSSEGVPEALERAAAYLKDQQRDDGGFGNVESTSWAMQAMAALDELPWHKDGKAPQEFLASRQDSDGGMIAERQEDRIWATAYAVPPSLWKSWGDILSRFERPAGNGEEGAGLARIVLPPSGEGKLVLRDVTSVKVRGEGTWNGEVRFVPALTIEEAASQAEPLSSLEPVGFAEVEAGEGVSLEFPAPAILVIPVFAQEGESLHVYVSSRGEEFEYLDSCVAAEGMCSVETAHFSAFAVVRKEMAEAAPDQSAGALEAEVETLRGEVAALKQEIALVREEYQLLAERQSELAQASAEEEPPAQEENAPVLSQEESPAGEQFVASAASTSASRFFASGAAQLILVLAAGIFLFLALRGRISRLQKSSSLGSSP